MRKKIFHHSSARARSRASLTVAAFAVAGTASGCIQLLNPTVSNVAPAGGAVSLVSPRLTRWPKAKVQMTCGDAGFYAAVPAGAAAPEVSSPLWKPCTHAGAAPFHALVDLPAGAGTHTLRFFFRSGSNGVSSETGAPEVTVRAVTQAQPFLELDPNPVAGAAFGDTFWGESQTVLSNGNFVLGNLRDNVGGAGAGAVHLFEGATGALIATIRGSGAGDALGGGVLALSSGNFVFKRSNGGMGAVVLASGTTGAVIATIQGDQAGDAIGNTLQSLPNGNFITGIFQDDDGAIVNAGSVMLVNGTSGAVIATFRGDQANDALRVFKSLTNGNFFLNESHNGAISNAGSIQLVNGATGAVINTIWGDQAADQIGGSTSSFTELSNGNVVVTNFGDDDGVAVVNAASIFLVSGTTGAVGSSRVDLQACKLEYSIVSPK